MQTKKIVKTVEKETRTAGKEVKTTEKEQKSAEKEAKTKNVPKEEKAVKVAKVELKEPKIEVKNITRAEYYTLKSRVIDLEKNNNARVYFFRSFGSGDYWSAINNSAQFYKNIIAPQIKRECNWRDDTDHKLRVQEIISIKDINLLHIAITGRGFKCDNRSNNTMRCYYLKNKVTDALLNAWRNSDEMRWHMAEKLVYPARRWVDMRQALFALTRSTQPMVNKMDSKTYGDYGSHMKQCLLGIMKELISGMGSDVDAMEKLIKMSDYVTEYHACLTFLIEMRLVKDRHAVQSAEKMVELDRLIDKEMQKICQREK